MVNFLPPMSVAIRGAQIMAGAVKRGEVHHLKAAMLLADLRGFSRLTDELPEEQIVELLNAFFDYGGARCRRQAGATS